MLRMAMRAVALVLVVGMVATGVQISKAEQLLVANGQARGQIVIDESAPRMTRLAAQELQTFIAAISGAELPIVSEPTEEYPLRVYVGRSKFTDALGVTDEGLDYGAYLIRSVPNGLILLGHDDDFVPIEPYTMSANGRSADAKRVEEEWDAITGDTFGNPRGVLGRQYNQKMEIHAYDERGSLNAVYGFLYDLGVRWYMPGDLGTIIPEEANIPLPQIDEVVHPVFKWRMMAFATYFSSPPEEILYYLRQGLNDGNVMGTWSHGLRTVTSRPEMMEKNPERYALVRGVRQTTSALGHGNQPCLSDEGLFDAAVRYARFMYDHYDLPSVSVMPQDGFQFCECELCEGKDTPDRGRDGLYSDYVWGFVNRVAEELYKTHPDRTVNCLAYGTYSLPPTQIEKLSPNVLVGIVHSRNGFDNPETREQKLQLREQWKAITDNPLWTWEHYLFSTRPPFLPYYFPHAVDLGIKSMKDDYFGEFIEVSTGPFNERGHGMHSPIINHLNVYVTARLQWDPDLDVDALLDEYYALFYGPAAPQMKAFIEYCEANRDFLRRDVDKINTALSLLDAAVAATPADTPYQQRIAMLVDYMQGITQWRDQLVRGREGVPETTLALRLDAKIVFDGRLDDTVWQDLPALELVEVKTGEPARTPSWFKMYWDGDDRGGHLVVGIYCSEPDMANLRVTGTENGDWRIFDGDNVELMIETQAHSYYQIAFNPDGFYADMDRNLGHRNLEWNSLAEVAAHKGDDYWSVEIRIPVTGEESASDPLHEVVGWRPSPDAPWHMQVGRQRLRGEDREWTAWSRTGSHFHDIMRFGRVE